MAYTISRTKTVFGDKRVAILDVTADAATQAVETGLEYVEGFSMGFKSVTASDFTIHENVDASGTAANGTLGVSGMTSGDEFYLVVFGR